MLYKRQYTFMTHGPKGDPKDADITEHRVDGLILQLMRTGLIKLFCHMLKTEQGRL